MSFIYLFPCADHFNTQGTYIGQGHLTTVLRSWIWLKGYAPGCLRGSQPPKALWSSQCLCGPQIRYNHIHNCYYLGWKRSSTSSSPTVSLTLPCPSLSHVSWFHIHTFPQYLQDGDSTTSLGKPIQCLTTLSMEKFLPDTQSESSLVQSEAVSSLPITCHLRKDTNINTV